MLLAILTVNKSLQCFAKKNREKQIKQKLGWKILLSKEVERL